MESAIDTLSVIVTPAALWAITATRAPGAWRGRNDPGRWASWATLSWMTATVTFDRSYDLLTRLSGLPNVGFVLVFTAGAMSILWLQRFLQVITHGADLPWPPQRSLALLGPVFILLSALGPMRQNHSYLTIHAQKDDPVSIILYLMISGWATMRLAQAARWCWSLATPAASRSLHWAMRLTAVGIWLLLVRLVVEYGFFALVIAVIGVPAATTLYGPVSDLSTVAMFGAGVIGACLGMPALLVRLRRARQTIEFAYAYRNLKWLRSVLAEAAPRLPGPEGIGRFAELNLRVYRITIEIRDAYLTLRPFQTAGNGSGPDVKGVAAARTEAMALHAALQRYRSGVVADEGSSKGRIGTSSSTDLVTEVRHLRRVAQQWRVLRSGGVLAEPAPDDHHDAGR